MAYGPYALGRKDGVVVFVPYASPGDLLEVRVTEVQSRYLNAEIVKILQASTPVSYTHLTLPTIYSV